IIQNHHFLKIGFLTPFLVDLSFIKLFPGMVERKGTRMITLISRQERNHQKDTGANDAPRGTRNENNH
ncbi:hypothetical protein, partial [Subdoligranulum variabile]|uniref:hypothetical protein n=1 Tax=Subdoligranulum variabile TaxID=214851 RepID=UPI0026F160DE